MSSKLRSPFFEASFFGHFALEAGKSWSRLHNFWPIRTFFTNLESPGDGQYDADALINFTADYDLETAL